MITPTLLREWNACWTDAAIRARVCDAGVTPRRAWLGDYADGWVEP